MRDYETLTDIVTKRITGFIKSPLYSETLKIKILDMIVPEFEFQIKTNSPHTYDEENWTDFIDSVFRMIYHAVYEFNKITIRENEDIKYTLVYDKNNIEFIVDLIKMIFSKYNAYIEQIDESDNAEFEWRSNGTIYRCTIH